MTEVLGGRRRPDDHAEPLPPFAFGGVAAVAASAAVALLASIGRYGFFGDELYFVAAGRRLTVGYADQGPLLPAIARAMDLLAPDSLVALRLPAVLVTVAAVVLTAQIAREFGGDRPAQVLAAAAYATSPFLLVQGTLLATNTIDTALWVVVSWLVIRWVRTRRDGLLLAAALVTAVDMQVKWLIPFFWIALAIGVAIYGPRELLRRPALWWGGAIVVVTSAPSLVWQAERDWPQLRLGGVVAAEQATIGGRYSWLPLALASAGVIGGLLLVYGVWALLRAESLRPYRFLGLMPVVLAVIFIVTGGRPYYAAGCYGALIAVGAVRWMENRRRSRLLLTAAVAALSVAAVVFSLPLRPESDIEPVDTQAQAGFEIAIYGRFGWSELAAGTAAAYAALPEHERASAVVIADSYWQASALDLARASYGLPASYSPNRGFGYFGTPPDTATTVLWVGGAETDVRAHCAQVSAAGQVDARLGYPGVTRGVTVWRCAQPLVPWSRAWPDMLRLN
ncbi:MULTISPECIES: glycosyltransferase family 39 protein [Nocardia]|uniref:Glycosyltransferase family 39 protein n=1 Tax=Nocardia implantans TaxID=3108168 RepID=A0ABU6AV15_9NOCA|nr:MULTISPECIES: glycosyltransferase family 39 protein [unclassified Nocardia]MBF6192533.1 glycosyltransferase family 39 protein [Nocardia beijingensis]MEA3527562.1 glycosyltransferase family 39 protein [Nocardia sp. CDC192]MEB3511270.1 glycosyltransferase family 39 protein [Nocardia sp. CDC186]